MVNKRWNTATLSKTAENSLSVDVQKGHLTIKEVKEAAVKEENTYMVATSVKAVKLSERLS